MIETVTANVNGYIDYEKEVLCIGFLNYLRPNAYIISYKKTDTEVIVKYQKRNWLWITYERMMGIELGDVDSFDPEYIAKALPEYVEIENIPDVVSFWRSKVIKPGYQRLRLKEGWIELKPSPEKTVITTQYRITS